MKIVKWKNGQWKIVEHSWEYEGDPDFLSANEASDEEIGNYIKCLDNRIITLEASLGITHSKRGINNKNLSFENAVKPVIKYINENHNPHTVVVIGSTDAVVYDGVKTLQTEDFLKN